MPKFFAVLPLLGRERKDIAVELLRLNGADYADLVVGATQLAA